MTAAWDQTRVEPLSRILVRDSDFRSDDDWIVIDSLADFANLARTQGGYLLQELPDAVRWSSAVTEVVAQISRNGVALYVHNCVVPLVGDAARLNAQRQAAERGLIAVGASTHASILSEVWTLFGVEGHASWRDEMCNDPRVKALEDRWFGLSGEQLTAARATWVRQLPGLEVVRDEDWEREIESLFSANPARVARLSELARAEEEEDRRLKIIFARQAARKAEILTEAGLIPKPKGGLLTRLFARLGITSGL